MPHHPTRPEIRFGVILPPRVKKRRRAQRHSVERIVRLLRSYEQRVEYWLEEAKKYSRATGGRRHAIACSNAFCCIVNDLRELVPAKHRLPNDQADPPDGGASKSR